MKSFDKFTKLHQQANPLLIGNIWDVQSAKIFSAKKFQAIGTSSAAVANSFGYEDGEHVPFALIVQLAKRVVEVVDIPLSVDIEGGFGKNAMAVSENIEKLFDVGVVGINIEDSLPGVDRALKTTAVFVKMLDDIINQLTRKNIQVFINVRTDSFLLGIPNPLLESIQRIKLYENLGVNGIFIPCIVDPDDIREVVASTHLPVNVMCMPDLPSFDELQQLGVKRISMGNSLHKLMQETHAHHLDLITMSKSFRSLFYN
jgi:2-methylisocitrate lyase-like PEP mutase family enzyme